jgi:hypothetical protein
MEQLRSTTSVRSSGCFAGVAPFTASATESLSPSCEADASTSKTWSGSGVTVSNEK